MNEFSVLNHNLKELIITLNDYYSNQIKEIPSLELTVFLQLIPFLITLFISIYTTRSNKKLTEKINHDNSNLTRDINSETLTITEKINQVNLNEKKIQAIQRKLEEFYYPFNLLMEKNRIIYNYFAKDERDNLKLKGETFKTLTYLLNKENFSENDKILLDEIITVNKELNRLIILKGGHVDRRYLREELSNLSTHITFLELAASNLLVGDADKFDSITFNIEISEFIKAEIVNLENEINNLSIY